MGILFTKMLSSLFGDKEARILVLGLDNAGKTTILYRLQMGEVVSTIPTIGFNVETVQHKNIKFQVWDLGGQTSIRQLKAKVMIPASDSSAIPAMVKGCHMSVRAFLIVQLLTNFDDPKWLRKDIVPLAFMFGSRAINSFLFHYFGRPYWRCYFPNTQAVIYVVDSSDTDRLVTAKDEFHAILQEEELKGAVVLVYANKQDLPGALDAAAVTEALELHKIKNRQWAIFRTSALKGEGIFEGLDWLSNTLKSGGG